MQYWSGKKIIGPECEKKADALEKMREVLEGTDVKVRKCMELRVSRLDDSITVDKVANEIANILKCKLDDVRTGELRTSPKGLCTLWVQCSLCCRP